MYFVQDAHSFWDWIYFVLLIVVSAINGMKNLLIYFSKLNGQNYVYGINKFKTKYRRLKNLN